MNHLETDMRQEEHDDDPRPSTRLEIRHLWQAAWLGRIGFSVKACRRGKRFFMVRNG